jgi:hypothetical protein
MKIVRILFGISTPLAMAFLGYATYILANEGYITLAIIGFFVGLFALASFLTIVFHKNMWKTIYQLEQQIGRYVLYNSVHRSLVMEKYKFEMEEVMDTWHARELLRQREEREKKDDQVDNKE